MTPDTILRWYRELIAALHREAAALVVGEPQPSTTQLLAEHSVLLLEVVDHVELARLTQPAKSISKNCSGAVFMASHHTVPESEVRSARIRPRAAMQGPEMPGYSPRSYSRT